MPLPLEGLLVVALEQAVAAPMCTCRLADAGARVIKIERPEGDFARGYDDVAQRRVRAISSGSTAARSRSSSISPRPTTRRCSPPCSRRPTCSCRTSSPARSPSSASPIERLRREHPRLIVCSVSGYGDSGPYADAQGLRPADPGRGRACLDHRRAGRSRRASASRSCDIGAGMNAYEAILEALIVRGRTGEGARAVGLAVRRHGGLDGDAADAAGGRQAAEARRPRAHLDRALRRVQEPRRRRRADLDPERPRVARARRTGAGRQGARRPIRTSPAMSSG